VGVMVVGCVGFLKFDGGGFDLMAVLGGAAAAILANDIGGGGPVGAAGLVFGMGVAVVVVAVVVVVVVVAVGGCCAGGGGCTGVVLAVVGAVDVAIVEVFVSFDFDCSFGNTVVVEDG